MSVDANAEGGPPKAVIAEIDVDVKREAPVEGVSCFSPGLYWYEYES